MITIKTEDFLKNFSKYIPSKTKVIAVAGGSGSGKSYLSKKLSEKINTQVIELDDYIIPKKITRESNWDLPECWDLDLVRSNLNEFMGGSYLENQYMILKPALITNMKLFIQIKISYWKDYMPYTRIYIDLQDLVFLWI